MDAWVEHELGGVPLHDLRLKNRLGRLLGDLGERIGHTLTITHQDWVAAKAVSVFVLPEFRRVTRKRK